VIGARRVLEDTTGAATALAAGDRPGRDRDYRTAQLRTGLVEGRLHLAANTLGAGASGTGEDE
jgi:hypothetical protein